MDKYDMAEEAYKRGLDAENKTLSELRRENIQLKAAFEEACAANDDSFDKLCAMKAENERLKADLKDAKERIDYLTQWRDAFSEDGASLSEEQYSESIKELAVNLYQQADYLRKTRNEMSRKYGEFLRKVGPILAGIEGQEELVIEIREEIKRRETNFKGCRRPEEVDDDEP